ncbi:MAG: metal ABC transporter ATP-binding protein [Candidatus Omnitrophota bacterium]
MSLIEIEGLGVKYRDIEALSGVSCKIEAGDYVGIVGPNGSGKTTLIKALLGLVPFEGAVRFGGGSFGDFTRNKHVGYLPQKMAFLDQQFPATAGEIVVTGVYCCKGFPKRVTREDNAAAQKAMEILEIADLKDRPIGRLSGGQQQRVLLARALVHSPQVLVLDEPTVALDPHSREAFYETVRKLNKDSKVTVLLVSHDIGSAGAYVSKLLYLDRHLVFYGTLDEFCGSPKMSEYFGEGQHMICHRHA